jgi:hypothetical protein
MPQVHRIDNPATIDQAEITQWSAVGHEVIVQFAQCLPEAPCPPALLPELEEACKRCGERLTLRFYSGNEKPFDCRVLRQVPSVASLAIDSLRAAVHLEVIWELEQLQRLAFGVEAPDRADALEGENLRQLKELSVAEPLKGKLHFSPVLRMLHLTRLSVEGEFTELDRIGLLSRLVDLSLYRTPKTLKLGSVNELGGLRRLTIQLGSRADLDDLKHSGLESLSIVRVRGLSSLPLERYPALKELHVEDQLQLHSISVAGNSDLERLLLLTCKGLDSVAGLGELRHLEELRMSLTKVDLESLLLRGLPPNLRILFFRTGKAKLDREIRSRLAVLGYCERRQ